MSKSNRSESFSTRPKTSRARTLAALGCIGMAGIVGYVEGNGSQQDAITLLRSDLRANEKALTDSQTTANQCRAALRVAVRRKKIFSKWLDFTWGQLENKEISDDGGEEALNQCVDITDSVFDRMANDLADLLDITNPNDIDKLFRAMKRGYTKLDAIYGEGKHIVLSDPNADPEDSNSSTYITLDEPMGDIPEEHMPDVEHKSDEMLALEQQLADGQAEQVIAEYPLDSLKPTGSFGDAFADGLHGHLTDIQKNFSQVDASDMNETDALNVKKDIYCRFLARISSKIKAQTEKEERMKSEGLNPESDSSIEPSDDDKEKMEMMSLYMDSLAKSLGIEDSEECILQYNNLDPCYSLEGEGED